MNQDILCEDEIFDFTYLSITYTISLDVESSTRFCLNHMPIESHTYSNNHSDELSKWDINENGDLQQDKDISNRGIFN